MAAKMEPRVLDDGCPQGHRVTRWKEGLGGEEACRLRPNPLAQELEWDQRVMAPWGRAEEPGTVALSWVAGQAILFPGPLKRATAGPGRCMLR